MHHADGANALLILDRMEMPLPDTPQSLLLQSVFISKLFPGHFGSTRNNSKCFFVSPDFSPNRGQRYNLYLYFDALLRKKCEKSWKITEKCLSLQHQNISFDYAAECGEQDLIAPAPFKSHPLWVAFYISH